MSPTDKWKEAEKDLSPEAQAELRKLREDYIAATKKHVPNYTGGPNAGILSELIRMGWRKSA